MLFAPEVQAQQEQHEKELKEARDFFEGMPENGLIVHGGLKEYSEVKKHHGLKPYGKDLHYYYIPNPGQLASEQELIRAHQKALSALNSTDLYAFGSTTDLHRDHFSSLSQTHQDEIAPQLFYKNHPELNPSLLFFKATKELADKFNQSITGGTAYAVATKDIPIKAESYLFEVTIGYNKLSKLQTFGEAQDFFGSRVLDRIKNLGWSPDSTKSKNSLESDAKYLNLTDIVEAMHSRSHHNPIYAEAIAITKSNGADINACHTAFEWIINEKHLITKEELAAAKNPMAIYEITRRLNQIKTNLTQLPSEQVRDKVLRMIGNGEQSLFKREKAIIEGSIIACKLKSRFPKSFVGLIVYGSQTDRYKPNSNEIDIRVIVRPSPDDQSRPYSDERNILNALEDLMQKQYPDSIEPKVIYYDDLTAADTDTAGNLATSIREQNRSIDYRSVPIIFGRKNRQLFQHIFQENLKSIQTKS